MFIRKHNEWFKAATIAVVALGVGFVAGTLTAPKSGKKTIEDISNNVGNVYKTMKKSAVEVNDSITEKEEELEKTIKETTEKVKDNFDNTVDDVTKSVEEVNGKLNSKIADAAGFVEEKAKQVKESQI